MNEMFVPLARAWIAVLDNDVPAAEAAGAEACETAHRSGATVHVAKVIHELARLGLRQATAIALRDVAAPRTAIGQARIGLGRHWLSGDAVGLEQVGTTWTTLGAPLFAAEAFTLAAGLHRQNKARGEATRLDGLAGQMLSTADPARTPLLRSRRTSGPLTPRLIEVATLVSQGLKASEIAARLVISERSVESHMQRIYQRLGVTSRAELAAHMEQM
jgi:DNA-binding CsgD family transcriptional regulator